MASDEAIQLNIRVEAGLREALRAAAERSGRSVNKEISERLWQSLMDDLTSPVSPIVGALTRLIGEAMNVAGHWAMIDKTNSTDNLSGWIDHPAAFCHAEEAAKTILRAARPDGWENLPSDDGRATPKGELIGLKIVEDVAERRHTSKRTKRLFDDIEPLRERFKSRQPELEKRFVTPRDRTKK